MKKIVFLHSSSELYGSDRSLLNLIKYMDKSKYSIFVILPCDGPLVEELKNIGVNVVIKEIAVLRRKDLAFFNMCKYIKNFFKSVLFLKKFFKENNIDIVYTNTSVIFVGGVAAKLTRKKSIWHVREIISNKFERMIVGKMVNIFSDIIIANSKATGEAITKNKNKLRVVYNAIEVKDDFCIKDKKTDNIVIGMAGRINRWKGQGLFVDMAEKVLKEEKQVKFLIAGEVYQGEDALRVNLKNKIKEKNLSEKVILLGLVNNMNEFYKGLDIFVLPSIKPEPFGLVVIEAMSHKLPVVATNHGGPVEIIDNEVDGFLVNYENAEEMSKVVLKLIRDKSLRDKIASNAKSKVDRKFTIKSYVGSIEKILSE